MSGGAEWERLRRAARAQEGPTHADRAAVRAGLRARDGIVFGAAAALASSSIAGAAKGAASGSASVAGSSSLAAGGGAVSSVAAGGTPSLAAGAALTKTLLAKSTLLWLAGGLAGGTAVSLGTSALVRHPSAEQRPAAASSTRQRHDAAPREARKRPVDTVGATSLGAGTAPPAPATASPDISPPAPSTAARPRVKPPIVEPSSLVAETRGLAEIQRALRDGQPARALAVLDAQDDMYRRGALTSERQAARVFALCALGRAEQARALARQFLGSHPASPLSERVRAGCRAAPTSRE